MKTLIELLIHPSQEYKEKTDAACWAEIETKCMPLHRALYPKQTWDRDEVLEKMPTAKRIRDKWADKVNTDFDAVIGRLSELTLPQSEVLDALMESLPMQPAYRRDIITLYLYTKSLPPKPSRWLTAIHQLLARATTND